MNWDLVLSELSTMESGGEQMLQSNVSKKAASQGDPLSKNDWFVGDLIFYCVISYTTTILFR